jgi:hypothetical protein
MVLTRLSVISMASMLVALGGWQIGARTLPVSGEVSQTKPVLTLPVGG